jgi:hypothetical protein
MAHLIKGAAGHLVKNAAGHLVNDCGAPAGCVDCVDWTDCSGGGGHTAITSGFNPDADYCCVSINGAFTPEGPGYCWESPGFRECEWEGSLCYLYIVCYTDEGGNSFWSFRIDCWGGNCTAVSAYFPKGAETFPVGIFPMTGDCGNGFLTIS